MAVFNNMVITTKGEALYNKVQAGKPLNFTKMKIGSGQLATGDDPTTFTALKQYAFDVSISSITPNTVLKVAVISGTINNNNITEGKYICELGLFANDPDEGEILYGYATAGTEGDWIAPSSKGAFAWNYQINAAVGNAQDVTATVSSTTFDYAVASTSTTFAIISGNNQKEINDSIDTTIGLIKNTVNFEVGSFTATADNTTSFQISSPYNPDTDHVELFYKGNDRMELGDNYTLNGTQVSLVGWSLLTGEKITYNIWKFVNHVPIMADGSNLQNGSVAERSLTQDIQDKIESVPESTGYGVISGLGVTAQSTPNMSVLVNSGRAHMPVSSKRVNLTSSTTIPITASDALKPRTDIVYINASGVPSYLASGLGTAAVAGTRNYTINTNAKVAVAGSNTYTISTNFASGDTVVFDGVTFTAVASGATGAQFNVGADYMISATNLASTLNTNSTINDNFTATANSNIVTIAERTAGNGDTPGTMTTTGTGVITAGTATTSTPADTVTINGVTFTAVASNATSNQFDVGGDTTATATNLVSALNANSTISGLYTANSSTNIITLIEKVAGGGNTPTVATTTGTVSIVSGTATNSTAQIYPTAPTTPDGGMLLYDIKVGAGATAITNLDLIDKRIFKLNNNQLASQMADIAFKNVDVFGAKGDSVTDDTTSVQNALNNGNVRFSRKTYVIQNDITIPSDRTIVIPNGCIINAHGRFTAYDVNNVHWIIDGEVNQVEVKTAPYKPGWPNTTEGTQDGDERGFIEFGGSINTRTTVSGFSVTGEGSVNGTWTGIPNIDDLHNQLNKKGIASWNCSDVKVTIAKVSGFEGEGVYWYNTCVDAENIMFENIAVKNCRFNGLNFNTKYETKDSEIRNCTTDNCYQGIESSSGNVINNKMYNSKAKGLFFGVGYGGDNRKILDNESYECLGDVDFYLAYSTIYNNGEPVKNITIRGNKSINCARTAFVCQGMKNLDFKNNNAYGQGQSLAGYAFGFYSIAGGYAGDCDSYTPGSYTNGLMKSNTNLELDLGKFDLKTGSAVQATQINFGNSFIGVGGLPASKTMTYGDRENRHEIRLGKVPAMGVGGEYAFSADDGIQHVYGTITADVQGYDTSGAIGNITIATKKPTTGSTLSATMLFDYNGNIKPGSDNAQNLGASNMRFAQLYAGAATINTSDEREKQQIQSIDSKILTAWGKVNYCQFKFNDAVELKSDGARWHFGVIAQRVKEAFESEGLDAFSYGLLCYDEWQNEYQDVIGKNGEPTGEKILVREAGNRYGIRYEEALALECAYLRSKLNA